MSTLKCYEVKNECFEIKLENQLLYIKDTIINGNNNKNFLIIDMEAGLKKSRTTEVALAEMYKLNPNRKTLFVQRFKDTVYNEGDFSTQDNSHIRINTYANKEIAMAIDSNVLKIKDINKKIKDMPIIIITHAMYMEISKHKEKSKLFTEGRETLIIDEEVMITKNLFYNESRINAILHKLIDCEEGFILQEYYKKCINPIYHYLHEQEDNKRKFFRLEEDKLEEINKCLEDLKNMYERHLKNDNSKYTGKKLDKEIIYSKREGIEEIEIIKNFYINQCIFENGNLMTYDNRIDWWMLEGENTNNIILDANGKENKLYTYRPEKFIFSNLEKIRDHSNWVLNINPLGTAKNKKDTRYLNFYDVVKKNIIKNKNDNNKILIVDGKKYEDNGVYNDILSEKIKVDHCGNLIGKNDYYDFDTVWLLHTNNLNAHDYVLKYLQYSKEKFNSTDDWDSVAMKIGDNTYLSLFTNQKFEDVKTSFLLCDYYQSLKRIARLPKMKGSIYLIQDNSEVINGLKRMLLNIPIVNYVMEVEELPRQYNNENRLENSYPMKFIQLLASLEIGKYTKAEIMDMIDYKTPDNFSAKVLKHAEVIKYLNDNSDKYTITKKLIHKIKK